MSSLSPRIAFPMLQLSVLAISTFLVAAEPTPRPKPQTAAKPGGWGVRQVLVADPKLPCVLLIGDSILNGYNARAADLLRGKVSLDVWVTPKHIGSKDLPADMKAIFAEHAYDVILFNDIGLHAWEPGRIPEGQYEPLLRAHLANLHKFAPKAKLIFATTTPMTTKTKPIAFDPEFNPLIIERNKIAVKVMAENYVPVADYHEILAAKLDLAAGDRFHWTKPAYELLAQCAATRIAEALGLSLSATSSAVEANGNTSLPGSEPKTARALDIAPVWSGHMVGFALLTSGKRQLVAFYDAERRMTVGARELNESKWQLVRLPSVVGWDSHNYVTLALDREGQIHLSGNMHCRPLVYFRTVRPYGITSFQQIPAMVGQNEQRCTYPRFLQGAQGELIFTYRDGSSGSGDQYFNLWNPKAMAWGRLIQSPLFAGGGKMNAYFVGPEQDKAGMFHVCWVWRNTPDCATNHDLCYARSKDLVHWEQSDGRPLTLPITLATAEIVDPVPPGDGMINGNTKIGFDLENRPILSYHKFDAQGKTQLYNARREAAGWKIYQTSQWDYRWDFHGGGSIHFEIGFGPIQAEANGALTQTYHHVKHGSGTWKVDPQTLRAIGQLPARRELPKEFSRLESTWPEMSVRTASDLGASDTPGVRYMLRWETLPANRDRPRPAPYPPPSMLRLYEIHDE